jgi:Tol biopolymer transport system component
MNKGLIIIILSQFVKFSFGQEFTDLYGDYLGKTPPGDSAVIFAPGIISLTDRSEMKIDFSQDGNECYYITSQGYYFRKRVNDLWTEPEIKSFDANLIIDNVNFCADGNRLYLTCINADYTSSDIWFVELTKSGWSDPQLLPYPFNTPSWDLNYTESDDGVIFITSDRPGSIGGKDIWCIQRLADQSLQIENLGPNVNSSGSDFTPCVAHDGSYLIFASARPNQNLYISFNKGNNEWTKAINMNSGGAKINFAGYWQRYPTLSPDGKYLFFNHHTSSTSRDTIDIYWVSTHVIVELKKITFAPKLAKQIPDMNIKLAAILNYVIPDSTFSCEYGSETLKYTVSLSNGAALPSWLHFNPYTKTLSGTPKSEETNTIKITAINADTVSDSCIFEISVIR